MREQMDWQPIETAPKDESLIVLWAAPAIGSHDGGIDIGWWFGAKDRWNAQHGGSVHFKPTHWMPLPDPPALLVSADSRQQKEKETNDQSRVDGTD